ncbi:UNVERIFIED_CONTAM: hypothetical protein PYX00_005686 [Menopon gallinae]|uniref:PH domain-containing protein n=1 Tax=Menopon gallinae TaxID=328185 RepID=A0AAW2HSE0_9NEOP
MEGVLWKWTNYWNGWQMRWFVLDNGVLAYYKSQEEVNQGCKGSLKVSACEISVHPTDNTRLDVIVPGEQHIYLKAASNQERQQWLVALGSTKACVTTRSRKESGDLYPHSLKSKRSELRLYCDLLMQQVHQLKMCATEENNFDVKKLNDASSLLSVTCDTFIKTLDDCMKLSDANFLYELPHQHITDVPLACSHNHKVKATIPVMKRSSSYEVSEMKANEKKS